MIPILLSVPVLGLLTMLQSAVVSRIPLLHGIADVVMLAVIAWALQSRVKSAWHWAVVGGLLASLVTALPLGVMLASYLLTTALALLFRYRLWHLTVLSMLIVTFAGTLITHLLSIGALLINDVPLPILDAFNLVTLPSLLLNLLLAIPVYIVLTDLAAWAYPEEIEV